MDRLVDDDLTSQQFQWPPNTEVSGELDLCAQPLHTSNRRHNRLHNLLRSIENIWLDPIALPLSERVQRIGWHPDGPDAYCDCCGFDVGEDEADEFGCAHCRGRRLPWSRMVRLGRFESDLRQWIHDLKFHRQRFLGTAFGVILAQQLRESVTQWIASHPHAPTPIVTPVPMSRRRRLTRGIDHTREIARGVSRELGVPLKRCLSRLHGPSQRAVPASQRQHNVSGMFQRIQSSSIEGRLVILIDDVMTTGATLRAASRALRHRKTGVKGDPSGPAEVWVGVLAVTPREDRRPDVGTSAGAVDHPQTSPCDCPA